MLRVRVKSKPMFKPQLLPYARLTHILGLHDLAFIYIFWHDLLNNLSLFTMKCQFQQIWNYCINVSMSGAGNGAPWLQPWHIGTLTIHTGGSLGNRLYFCDRMLNEFSHIIYEQDCYSKLFTILKGQFDTLYVTFVLVVQYGYVVQQL